MIVVSWPRSLYAKAVRCLFGSTTAFRLPSTSYSNIVSPPVASITFSTRPNSSYSVVTLSPNAPNTNANDGSMNQVVTFDVNVVPGQVIPYRGDMPQGGVN